MLNIPDQDEYKIVKLKRSEDQSYQQGGDCSLTVEPDNQSERQKVFLLDLIIIVIGRNQGLAI